MEKFLEYGMKFRDQDDPYQRTQLWLDALRGSIKIRRDTVITGAVEEYLSNLPAVLAEEDLSAGLQISRLLVESDDYYEIQLGVELAEQCLRRGGWGAGYTLEIACVRGIPREEIEVFRWMDERQLDNKA